MSHGQNARVFVLDNYDSFTYNLVQLLGRLGAAVTVARNDRVTVGDIRGCAPTHLVISPGPCTPTEAGVAVEAVAELAGALPVLGVCLGHQCIAAAFGGTVSRAPAPVHGKTDSIAHDGTGIFAGIPSPLVATRYHSLIVDDDLPEALELTAWNEAGLVMGIRHRTLSVEGVQFHPESILTPEGGRLIANFLETASGEASASRRARVATPALTSSKRDKEG